MPNVTSVYGRLSNLIAFFISYYQTFTNCVSSYWSQLYSILFCHAYLYIIEGRSLEMKNKPLYLIIYDYSKYSI